MEQTNCLKDFIRYTSLNVLGMIGLSFYILADTFFVSNGVGANGLTALNLAVPVYSFIHGSGLMFGIGGASKYSVLRGQKAYQDSNRVFTNTVYAAGLLSVIFVLLGVFASNKITVLLGADNEVFDMTKTYLSVLLYFAPAFIMNDVLICFVRNDGNPKLSMSAMLAGSFSNIILDYIFIYPFGMGIFGAVLATGFAPIISMLILSVHFRNKNCFRFKLKRPDLKLIGTIFSLGIPSLITELASGIVIIVFNIIILAIQGNVGVAAYGVIANISLVVASIYTGIAQGMQPIVSSAYGRGNISSVKLTLKYAVVTMLAVSVLVYTCIFIFAGPITGIFNSGNNGILQSIAEQGLKIYFTAVPFMGLNIVISMFFIAVEKAIPAQAISLLRGIVLIIPIALLMSFLASLIGVWLTLPMTEGLVAILGIVLYCRVKKRLL